MYENFGIIAAISCGVSPTQYITPLQEISNPMVNHLDNLLLMYNITEKEWYTKKINNAMVRHLGQSKPRDATQTAQIPQKLQFNISWIAR